MSIRNNNEFRPTLKNGIMTLITKTGNTVDIYSTQMSFLKSKKWYNYGNTVATMLNNDVIVTIEDYLKNHCKNIVDSELPVQSSSVVQQHKPIETIKMSMLQQTANNTLPKINFDKKDNRLYINYKIGENKWSKKSYSINKYGEDGAKRKLENFIKNNI